MGVMRIADRLPSCTPRHHQSDTDGEVIFVEDKQADNPA